MEQFTRVFKMLRMLTVLALLIGLAVAENEESGQIVLGIFRKVHINQNESTDEPSFSLIAPPIVLNTAQVSETPVEEVPILYEHAQEEVNETIHRIVGGRQVSIYEVPWQAAIIQDGSFVCGGSVISTIWVLTAAHCVYGYANSTFIVRAGSDTFRTGGQARRVGFTAVHGQYNQNSFNNDIAMLRTTRRFTFSNSLQPASVPTLSTRIPSAFVVSGWGVTSATSTSLTRQLRAARLNLVNRLICARNYASSQYTITNNMICATASGSDSCQGDSGGGLVSGGTVFGVTSFGIGCANSRYPGVYTSVPYMNSWIRNVARLFSRRRNLGFKSDFSSRNQHGINIVLI